MSLYPTLVVAAGAVNGMHALSPSCLGLLPLTLAPGGLIQFRCYQLSDTQDFSIRAWLSLTQDGAPLRLAGLLSGFWSLGRVPDRRTVLFDVATGYVTTDPALAMVPGTVWLNLLNLVSAENVFSFSGLGVD